MTWFDLLLAATAFAATSGAVVAVLSTVGRIKAERDYLALLQNSSEAAKLRRLYTDFLVEDGRLSDEELAKLIDGLEQLARRMPAEERAYIVNALKQSSMLGRERYVTKVFRDSAAA